MKKPQQKYRLVQAQLWTAARRGSATGYGATPEKAYDDAMARRNRSQMHRNSMRANYELGLDQARHHLERMRRELVVAHNDNEMLQQQMREEVRKANRMADQIIDMRARASDAITARAIEQNTTLWLATAMAVFGAPSPEKALELAIKAGLEPGTGMEQAVKDLQYFVDGWLTHFRKVRATQGLPATAQVAG